MRVSKKKKIITFMSCVCLIVVAHILLGFFPSVQQREENLRAAYDAIEQPAGAQLIQEYEARKVKRIWFSAIYTYPLDEPAVVAYFDKQLQAAGWEKTGMEEYKDSAQKCYMYKKKDMLLDLTYLENYHQWSFFIQYDTDEN